MKTIGLILQHLTGVFGAAIMAHAHAAAARHGYQLLACRGTPRDFADSQLAHDLVDGWVVGVSDAGLEDLIALGRPVVAFSLRTTSCDCIYPDNAAGAGATVRHLIEHGHRRIGFVTYAANEDFRQRQQAHAAALAEIGVATGPELLADAGGYQEADGYAAAERLLAGDPGITAIVAASDSLAFGVLRAVAEHTATGRPIAVAGFDDDYAAQNSAPPLTTVRALPEWLATAAVDALHERLQGLAEPPRVRLTPAKLVVRESCGCAPLGGRFDPSAADAWQVALALTLARRAQAPLPYDPAVAPIAIWPGIETLVGSLEAAAADQPPASAAAIGQAWRDGLRLAPGFQALADLQQIFAQAALYVRALPDTTPAAATRIDMLLQVAQRELMHAFGRQEDDRVSLFARMIELERQVTVELSSMPFDEVPSLRWLRPTPIRWSMLARWEQPGTLRMAGSYSASGAGLDLAGQRYPSRQFPPLGAVPAHLRDSAAVPRVVLLRTQEHEWGVFVYSEPPSPAGYDSVQIWGALLGIMLEGEQLVGDLNERQATLQQAYDRERALADTVRELGCPIIPVLPDVLLVPLVGAIDSVRAQQIIEQVLLGVSREQASRVLLDITGVPVVDAQVAAALLQTARAAGLLGARVTLVGVRPEIAQHLVGLGADLQGIETRASLASAFRDLARLAR